MHSINQTLYKAKFNEVFYRVLVDNFVKNLNQKILHRNSRSYFTINLDKFLRA